MIWTAIFAIYFTLKQKKELTIKQHCLLFFDGEPHIDNAQSYQVHTCQAGRKAWVDSHGEYRYCIDDR